jgi:hypothetical protein
MRNVAQQKINCWAAVLQSGRINKGLCNYEAAIDRFREAAELQSKNMRK